MQQQSINLNYSVLSVDLIERMVDDGYTHFLELGSSSALSSATLTCLERLKRERVLLVSLHAEQPATPFYTLCALYTAGYPIVWSALYFENCQCISLPFYQWQRERLWLDHMDVTAISTPPENSLVEQTIDTVYTPGTVSGSTLEETLMLLWADVLDLDHVEAHDSFFELGGHSLLAVQLLERISRLFDVEVTLSNLLVAPTPAGSATFIEQSRVKRGDTPVVLPTLPIIQPDPQHRYQPFPTTDVQQAYWIGRNTAFEIGSVGNHGYIEVEANDLSLERFNLALSRLIERHEMLRAVLLPDGQQQILEQVPPFQINVVDLRKLKQSEQDIQLNDIRRTLDHQIISIEQFPSFEIYISRLSDSLVRIHLSIESLFIDAWSMNILIHEFTRLYHDPTLELPPLELSFRDYVLAEEALHTSELYRRSQQYWTQRLPTLPPAPELPLLQNGVSTEQPRFIHREARLEKSKWQCLKARAARSGLTPSGVLLAAFADVIATWSKTSRFGINLSTFNRLPVHPEINSIVGDFTSLIVLAVDNSVVNTFEQRVRYLQKQLWNDLDHSYYSGIRVLRELARNQGGLLKAVMPIVFTSLLIQDTAIPLPPPWQKTVYCVSQTPQVWLDHQVLEDGGTLVFHWQSVDALFPAGLIDEMFAAYCAIFGASGQFRRMLAGAGVPASTNCAT